MHCRPPAAWPPGLATTLTVMALSLASAVAHAQPTAQAASPGVAASPSPAPGAQSDPRQASTVATQARRLMTEKKPQEALSMLDAGLRAHPNDPQLRFLYGVAVADLGRTQDAIDVFRQLAADFPELPEPHNNLAVLYAAAGDLDKARAALDESVRAAPGYALAHENLGDLHLRLAVRAYERSLQVDARNASARGKLELARELLNRVAQPPAAPATRGSNRNQR